MKVVSSFLFCTLVHFTDPSRPVRETAVRLDSKYFLLLRLAMVNSIILLETIASHVPSALSSPCCLAVNVVVQSTTHARRRDSIQLAIMIDLLLLVLPRCIIQGRELLKWYSCKQVVHSQLTAVVVIAVYLRIITSIEAVLESSIVPTSCRIILKSYGSTLRWELPEVFYYTIVH